MGILDDLIQFFIEQVDGPPQEYYYYDGDTFINADTNEHTKRVSNKGIVVAYPIDNIPTKGE
jgi:hypothetical protein